ncbi:MAG: pyridoxamine 5'-phosphate oxidase family protein [Thermotogota bacterium]
MFREMRRKKQVLSKSESIKVLDKGTSGVLALIGDDDYPYAVPISYVYKDNKIYFHCAYSGHKIDALKAHPKVSFCIIDKDQIIPEEFTTYYRSVIIFGQARILEDEKEKKKALKTLAAKYSPSHEKGRLEEINKLFQQTCMVEIVVEHLSGKEAIELTRERKV